MLSISHALTGAYIATKIDSPWLSIPLILATHYLQDAIPHWDAGTGLTKGTKTRRNAFLQEIPDLLIALLLVLLLFPPNLEFTSNLPTIITNLAPLWGAFLGLLPDFLEAPRNFLGKEPRFLRPLNAFHHSFHHSIPRVIDGLAPQLLLLILIILTR